MWLVCYCIPAHITVGAQGRDPSFQEKRAFGWIEQSLAVVHSLGVPLHWSVNNFCM